VRNLHGHDSFSWGGTKIRVWSGLVEDIFVYFLEPQNGYEAVYFPPLVRVSEISTTVVALWMYLLCVLFFIFDILESKSLNFQLWIINISKTIILSYMQIAFQYFSSQNDPIILLSNIVTCFVIPGCLG
jgi:hypothetical protein